MESIENLKKQIAKLNAEKETRKDFAKRDTERKNLSKQLWNMKHPNLAITKDIFKSSLIKASTGMAKMGSSMAKKMNKNKSKKTKQPNLFAFRLPKF